MLVKAAAGGGGKGMRLISADDDLESAYASAGAEADAAFGDGALYLEKALVPARHVEVQVLCDGAGGIITLGERECSIQRRHQKLVEESPSPALAADARDEMESAVERACAAIGYVNAGTFEFLLGPDGGFHFIEVNCRLQVEHPVSELVTGIDIVREQVRIASGERLEVTGRASRRGHAIEIGSTPSPARGFAPRPGPSQISGHHSARECASTPQFSRSRDPAVLRLADREGDRLGRGTPGGDRACAAEPSPSSRWRNPDDEELALDVIASPEFRSGEYSTSTLAELEGRVPSLSVS